MGNKLRKTDEQAAIACPCGSGQSYYACCQAHQLGTAPDATTPEKTMRARYTAFTLGLADYLRASWAPRNRPPEHWTPETDIKWLGLKVISASAAADGNTGTVEFIARSRVAGKGQRHHETSYFERLDGRWVYVNGEIHE